MGLMDFFSPEAGQARRRWLEETGQEALSYVPPELRPLVGLLADSTPSSSIDRASQASQVAFNPATGTWERVGAVGDMLSETAGAALGLGGTKQTADMAAPLVEDMLNAGARFAADESGALRLRTPGAFTVRGDEFFDAPHGIPRKKDPALYTGYSGVKHTVAPSDFEVTGQILPTLMDPEIIDAGALQGKTLYFPTGDRTSNQRLIESINGVKLPEPVLTHGGPEYKDFQGSWASERNALTARTNALEAAVRSGEDPVLAYMPMGERSGDFSEHVGRTFGGLVDEAAARGAIDANADSVIPEILRGKDFPGLGSGKFGDWLAAQKGGRRAAIIKALDSSAAQSLGVPEVSAARFATTTPDLVNSQALNVGFRFSVPDMQTGLLKSNEHPSYNAKLERAPGTTSQSLGFEVPWWIGARDEAAAKVSEKGYALPKDIKSFMGNPQLKQRVDQQWVDEVSTYGNLLETQGQGAADRYARGLLDAILLKR